MPPPSLPGDLVDDDVETRAQCPQCGTKAKWRGEITEDMQERTFTRGLDASGMPNCLNCGTPMQLTRIAPIEDTLEQVAAQLPADQVDRPRQRLIPGLLPAFNFEAAFHSIIDQRKEVRRAEAFYESKHKDAQRAKKVADEEQTKLSQLEDDYEERAKHRDDEETDSSAGPKGCAFERATGKPCGVCTQLADVATRGKLTIADQVHIALAHANEQLYPKAEDLAALITLASGVHVTVDDVLPWQTVQVRAVLEWLAGPMQRGAERPAVMGRSHVVGELANGCRDCGALLQPLAKAHRLDEFPVGAVVGIDCQGPPEVEEARTPAKRHTSKESRQKARQAASRAEREAAAPKAEKRKKATNGSGKPLKRGKGRK